MTASASHAAPVAQGVLGQAGAIEQLGPEARAIITAVGDRTREALAALSPAKRETLVLAYWGGYTQREISTLTSTPVGTIKSRMHTAMTDLSTSLRDQVSPQERITRRR